MRAPFQVLIYLYRTNKAGELEYAMFQRTDMGIWQGITGGGEDAETPLQAAKRETQEESGLLLSEGWIQLQTNISVPAAIFRARKHWPKDLYVIPIHCFGVPSGDGEIVLSHEHTQMEWLSYTEAQERIHFNGERTALWELNERMSAHRSKNT